VLTGFAGAAVAQSLGASPRATRAIALGLPLLPSGMATLSLCVSDALAVGLALTVVAADLRGRRGLAIACAIGTVLTKEAVILVVVGWVLYRGRQAWSLVIAPAVVAAGWWLYLRLTIPASGRQVVEFEPILGFVSAVRYWLQGLAPMSAIVVLGTLALTVWAIRERGIRHPLGLATLLQLAFFFLLADVVLFSDVNGPRAVAAMLPLAVIMAVTPNAASTRLQSAGPAVAASADVA
jgi:hypothetical protein